MLTPNRIARSMCFIGTVLALNVISESYGHLSRDECVQGSGCIAGKLSGQATFEFIANTTANPKLHSGNFNFTDASAGISVSSDVLIEYGDGSTESERLLAFQLTGGVYSEARVFVTDSGPASSDNIRVQLLDNASVPVLELSGALLEACGGGITIAPACVPPVPCEIQISVSCALAGAPNNPDSSGCNISGSSGNVIFYYTLKNTGTAAIALSSLSGTDSFGPLDLSSLGNGQLAPGEEITLTLTETVSGTFPFVNTVTINSSRNGVVCSDMATITIRTQSTPPGGGGGEPGAECDDFVTGGGWIVGTPSGGKANFGVHGGIRNGALWGGLNYIDHKTKLHVKSTAITGYSRVAEATRQLRFTVTINGAAGTAVVQVQDNGEPGRNDVFRIQLSNGYLANGDLGGSRPGGGNLQLHRSKCDGEGGTNGGGPGGSTTGSSTSGSTGSTTGGGPGGETGGSSSGGTGGGSGGSVDACPLTIGYWKNHEAHLSGIISLGSINLGSSTIRNLAEALAILNNANASDARLMLRAQLLAAMLNLRNGADPLQTGSDIRVIIEAAVEFLASHNSAVEAGHSDRAEALSMKDRLDAYNNSKEHCSTSSQPGSGGSSGGGSTGGSGGAAVQCAHTPKCRTPADCGRKTKAGTVVRQKNFGPK